MKRGIVTAVLVFICFILQTSVFELIKLAGITPNILLILISSVAVMRGQKPGMIVGFFCGLLMDIFYGSTIGGFAFLYMVFGFVDGFFNRIYYSDHSSHSHSFSHEQFGLSRPYFPMSPYKPAGYRLTFFHYSHKYYLLHH